MSETSMKAGTPGLLVLMAFLFLSFFPLPSPAGAQTAGLAHMEDNRVWGADWRMADRFSPYKMDDLVYSLTVGPRWIGDTNRFWYEWETSDGSFFYIVDPGQGTKREIFDRDRIASELTRITKDPWDAQHLPIRDIEFVDENTLRFEVESSQEEEVEDEEEELGEQQEEEKEQTRPKRKEKKIFYFEYDVDTRTLRELEDFEEPRSHPGWASVSPDSTMIVFSRQCNLHMMGWDDYMKIVEARHDKEGEEADSAEAEVEVDETQLTEDGERYYCYGSSGGGRGTTVDEWDEEWEKRQPARVAWSHDSRYFALTRQDERAVKDLWVIHVAGAERPKLESYKYAMAGDSAVDQTELLVYDTETSEMKEIEKDPWQDQSMGIYMDPTPTGDRYAAESGGLEEPRIRRWLSPEPELHFYRASRDLHRIDVMVADPATGEVGVLVEERMNTYQEQQQPRRMANGDFVWWSERDGWAHLYLYGPDGTLETRLTDGPWHVDRIVGIDEERGRVFFVANAREEGEDPYYTHLYSVNLDGGGLTLLNPGNFNHRSYMNEANRYFVDNYSRVNTVPAVALYDADGRKVMDLEQADFSGLESAGYEFPEPFQVEAADGVTDIYGVMYKPFDFDPAMKYPIVAYVYPGPQTESVAKSFSTRAYEVGLAQMGFVVITIGNRGGHPDRSKWYHNYGYGNLRDYGLADKKVGIEQLADRHPFIDIDRVGIYGHSGGGFMSTAAMLVYPDFFKAAVSSSGNHDNSVYNRWWSETHHGVKEVTDEEGNVTFEYDIDKNQEIADHLKGHLLLTTGDVDNNVHHAGTFRVAEALIKANKRFDFFMFPGQRHGYGNMGDYWFWLRAEYFAKHLLGDERTAADIDELNNDEPKTR
jgi:dipeptidyl aminopeptidase/acylaminoacyl peptidase